MKAEGCSGLVERVSGSAALSSQRRTGSKEEKFTSAHGFRGSVHPGMGPRQDGAALREAEPALAGFFFLPFCSTPSLGDNTAHIQGMALLELTLLWGCPQTHWRVCFTRLLLDPQGDNQDYPTVLGFLLLR